MTLLAFNSAGTGASAGAGASAPANIAELLTPAQRAKTAGELNAAILESMSQGKEAKLAGLIRLMAWGENMLENHDVEFPKMEFPIESEWEGNEGNVKTSA
jgi:CTLH/CRA C-terminal to LisH motif domain